MQAPKPPLACTGYAIGKDPVRIRYDGRGRFSQQGTGEAIEGQAWLTSAVEPGRYAGLAAAHGSITDREVVSGRPTLVAEVVGLRGGKGTLRVWIDEELGCIVRMERTDDPAPLVVLDAISVG
jgi:hypothetical protein